MREWKLKYGCNPNQGQAKLSMPDGSELPLDILNGKPGYINFLDALNSWQLVSEMKKTLGISAAASFKHVSPSGAALGLPMSEALKKACFVEDIEGLEKSPLAMAYARARGVDRMSSFGDFAALSDVCDETTARILKREVSDGVIAPGYTEEALKILRKKKKGNYNILRIDEDYHPAALENKEVFGIRFTQERNEFSVTEDSFWRIVTKKRELPASAKRDMTVALLALKYTQSNSVCYAFDGQVIGVGAGQQSRIHCTRIAGDKADHWTLRQCERVLSLPFRESLSRAERDNVIDMYLSPESEEVLSGEKWEKYFISCPKAFTKEEQQRLLAGSRGLVCGSDAFFPFGDNVERARKSGVSYIVQPGGSVRDSQVIETADAYGMVMCFTGLRLFHH